MKRHIPPLRCRRSALGGILGTMVFLVAASQAGGQAGTVAPGPATPPAAWDLTTESEAARQAFEAGFDEFVGSNSLQALEQMERALAADPGLGAARGLKAWLRQELSTGEEFQRALSDAARGSAAEALLVLVARESRAGRTANARALAAALAAVRPNDPRVAVFHATFLPGDDEPDALRRLAREHPDLAAAPLWLAIWITPAAHVELPGELEREGIAAARTALRLSPRSPATHGVLARILARTGNNVEALEHIGHAISLGSPLSSNYETAAEIHLQEGRIPEAREALEAALQHARGDGQRLLYRRGQALLHLHEGDVARSTAALRALAAEAEREGRRASARTTHHFLAVIHAADGDREKALHHLAEAQRVSPTVTTQANYANMVHAWLGNAAQARAALETYIEGAGPEPTAAAQDYIHIMTGETLLAEGKPGAAIEELSQAGDNPYAQLARWRAYEALGRTQEAEEERKNLLERKNFSLYSTGTPIARYKARRR